jgi:hypothetical protein
MQSYCGKFAVNLGIMLPAVVKAARNGEINDPMKCKEYDCQIRQRLGGLLGEFQEKWWAIQPPLTEVGAELTELLRDKGLPFLEQFNSYQNVLNYYELRGMLPRVPAPRSALIAAILFHQKGYERRAREVFMQARELAGSTPKPGFIEHVIAIEKRCLPEPSCS